VDRSAFRQKNVCQRFESAGLVLGEEALSFLERKEKDPGARLFSGCKSEIMFQFKVEQMAA